METSVQEMVDLEQMDLFETQGEAHHLLHQRGGEARAALFGNKIFVRGVVEVSNFCRQNCHYCGMRRDNRALGRYRLSKDRLLDLVLHHRPSSITDINIQAGEDPVVARKVVVPLVREIRRQTRLGISVCMGTLSQRDYAALRESGADYYIIKLETGDAAHYQAIEAPGALDRRIAAIRHLAATGWKVSSGCIVGLPRQTREHLEKTLDLLAQLPLDGCSVSPFIAGEQTPFAGHPNGSLELTLNCLAWMRLKSPRWVIPAVSAMGIVGEEGYARAIRAGANLATINLTPGDLRKNYVIYKQDRLIMDEERVLNAIDHAGCAPSKISLCEHLRRSSASSR